MWEHLSGIVESRSGQPSEALANIDRGYWNRDTEMSWIPEARDISKIDEAKQHARHYSKRGCSIKRVTLICPCSSSRRKWRQNIEKLKGQVAQLQRDRETVTGLLEIL